MSRHRSSGFALITVLGVLAVLVVIVLGFGHRSLLERRAAVHSIDRAQVLYMARGAAMRGMVELRNKNAIDLLQEVPDRTSNVQRWSEPVNLLAGAGAGEREPQLTPEDRFTSARERDISSRVRTVGRPQAARLSERGEAAELIPEQRAGEKRQESIFELGEREGDGDECAYVIFDAESKININRAPTDFLNEVDNLSLSDVRNIESRREDAGEIGRTVAYFTLEEFRQLEDIDDDDWFGDDDTPGLKDILTVWGDGKININTAPAEVIQYIPEVDGEDIEKILMARGDLTKDGEPKEAGAADDVKQKQKQSFGSFGELRKRTGISGKSYSAIRKYCKLDSRFFTIRGIATQRQGKVRAQVTATVELGGESTRTLDWREELVGS